MIALFSVTSFALCEWAWRNYPTANFYLAPTRVWELFSGSMAAFAVQKGGVRSNDCLSFLGLLSIVISIFIYDEGTPFPSFFSLLVIAGTVLLILFADENTVAAKILGVKPIVEIGLVSYSAYLWHQPLFAFARIRSIDPPSAGLMGVLAVLAFVLAVLTWKFIERPFRNRSMFSTRTVFTASAVGIICFVLVGYFTPKGRRIFFTQSQEKIFEARNANRAIMEENAYDRFGCFFDYKQKATQLLERKCIRATEKKRLILLGDSEAAHYLQGFKSLERELDAEVMQFTGASCRAVDFDGNTGRCAEFFEIFENRIVPELTGRDTVFVSSNWGSTHRDIGDRKFRAALGRTVSMLKRSAARVVLIGNAPGFGKDPYETAAIVMGG